MRKRIIDWFFTLQSQRGILGEKERRFYTYAYGLLLNKIAIYAIIAIVGTTSRTVSCYDLRKTMKLLYKNITTHNAILRRQQYRENLKK